MIMGLSDFFSSGMTTIIGFSPQQLLTKDFRELRSTVEKMGLLTPNLLFFYLIFLHIILFDIGAWLIIWHFGTSSIPFFTGVAFFTIAQVWYGSCHVIKIGIFFYICGGSKEFHTFH